MYVSLLLSAMIALAAYPPEAGEVVPGVLRATDEVQVRIQVTGQWFPQGGQEHERELQQWAEHRLQERGVRLAEPGRNAPVLQVKARVIQDCTFVANVSLREIARLSRVVGGVNEAPVYATTWEGPCALGHPIAGRCWSDVSQALKDMIDRFADALIRAHASPGDPGPREAP
jgi:hypothetical protein